MLGDGLEHADEINRPAIRRLASGHWPPLTTMVGIFTLRAPISIPGTILSQFGTQITASKQCALSMDSTLSAINSRLAGILHTHMSHRDAVADADGVEFDGNSARLANLAFMYLATLSRCTCPGIDSVKELHTAMNGFPKSSALMPVALSRLL